MGGRWKGNVQMEVLEIPSSTQALLHSSHESIVQVSAYHGRSGSATKPLTEQAHSIARQHAHWINQVIARNHDQFGCPISHLLASLLNTDV